MTDLVLSFLCPIISVLKGEWQHREALILAGTVWHNYDTNRCWYLEMLPVTCFTKLLLGVEEIRQPSTVISRL